MTIVINFGKAKIIAHQKRRIAREEEFKPYDEIIMKQIPGNAYAQAESARQTIREKYAVLQAQMDSAQNLEELKSLIP